MGLAATGLMIPTPAKCKMIAPILDIVGDNYLDARIKVGIQKLKQEHPTLKVGETHCHTTFSDGSYSPAQLMLRTAKLGMDFLVITDHWIPGLKSWWPLSHPLASIAESARQHRDWNHPKLEPVTVYPAFELSTVQGHLIAVFPEEIARPGNRRDLIRSFSPLDDQMVSNVSMEKAALLVKPLDGITIIPHPNINRYKFPFGVSTPFVKNHLLGLVDAIEDISTGHGYHKTYSKELGLAAIGSSDDHFNFMIGTTVTAYDSAKHKDFISAVQARETKAIKIEGSLDDLILAGRKII